ncbi:heme-degrading domain-containing protein [Brenneria roseae subsp. americana]|uniref:UPF0303 protein B4923_14730 n=1 Tax=Brenneria roseae subsp. americana TaxID=1508507 RepID=A0A2U1TP13_9GAMM|nr:heme-degrading domain-containing protein [Brenneria roseae]PWC11143.1 heme-degrading domain-containing protein [Brenneria roseae subsp. americana]
MNVQHQFELCQQQQQLIVLPEFNRQLAWSLGEAIKHQAERQSLSLAMSITVNHQTWFSYAMPGTTKENLDWLRRKRNVVELLEMSSYAASLMLQVRQTTLSARYGVNERDYAAFGGGFPLQVKHAGIVGSVVVSGAPHREDHSFLVGVLARFAGLTEETIDRLMQEVQ